MQIQKLHEIKRYGKIFIRYLRTRIHETMILSVASSLSYTTLIAVVPLLAIALAIFAAFPMYADIRSQVQDFLIHYFVPDFGENIEQVVTLAPALCASAKVPCDGNCRQYQKYQNLFHAASY